MHVTVLKKRVLIVSLISMALVAGCSVEKMAHNAGKGLSTSLGPAVDSIGRNLVNALREELTKEPSRKELQHFIDSLLSPVLLNMRNTVGSVRDSFTNHQTLIWADSLLQAFTGERLNKNLLLLQASVLGKTKADIFEIEHSFDKMVAKIMAEALSDSNRIKIGLFRDDLLGSKTSNAINTIIDTAVKHIVDSAVIRFSQRMRSDVDPLLRDNLSFVRKNAVWLIVALAAVAAVIVLMVWYSRRKYLRLVAMLAKQIDAIPSQDVYDNVTSKIKDEAITTGLEPTLRQVLTDNGLMASQSWIKNIKQP